MSRLPLDTVPDMALRDILVIPDARLKLVSTPVESLGGEVKTLVADMFETMYAAPGIGLAAIQIGVPKRLVVMDITRKDEPRQPMVFINPEITWESEETNVYEEGCLSIPEYYENVERPKLVRVRFTDETGATKEIEADGLLATCIQHEIDHLNGKLFIDHLSRLKRERVMTKFTKLKRREG
jgi:peptide deformylase